MVLFEEDIMKTKHLLTLLVLALVVATCLCLVGCGECKHPELETTVVSKPTCTTDGVTNYSCSSCGYNETKTTPKLSQIGHNFDGTVCSTCNYTIPKSTDGLEFTSYYDGKSYICTGIGSCTSSQIFIGSYNNKPVKAISYDAFKNCFYLTSVTLGDSVISIGSSAFKNCSRLTSIVISDSVTTINGGAFEDCHNLTHVKLGNSITSIEDNTFYSCSNLTSVVIPNSVRSIGDYAFYDCDNLKSVTLGNRVTSIGHEAFARCNLTSIVIPNSVTTIGATAFSSYSNLTIYCEATERPDGWNWFWNDSDCPVYWAGEWHYDDNGNPTPNN